MKITRAELVEMLKAHKGATPVSMLVTTIEKDIFGKEYTKVNKVNGMIGFRYENSVNRALDKADQEADFQAGKRQWGTHMKRPDGTLIEHLIEHTNKAKQYRQYVQIKIEKTGKPIYIDNQGRVHGSIVKKERKQYLAESLGVILRDYGIDTIQTFNYKGQRLKIA